MMDQIGQIVMHLLEITHTQDDSWETFKKNIDDIQNKLTSPKPFEADEKRKDEALQRIQNYNVEEGKKISTSLGLMIRWVNLITGRK